MQHTFIKGSNHSTQFNNGYQVCWSSKKISTKITRRKLDHQWLGPYAICKKVSISLYKLKLPFCMKHIHPVFPVLLPGSIVERQQLVPKHDGVNGNEEWEFENILNFRRCNKNVRYIVSWTVYLKPRSNLNNCVNLMIESCFIFPDAGSLNQRTRRKRLEGKVSSHWVFNAAHKKDTEISRGSLAVEGGGCHYMLGGCSGCDSSAHSMSPTRNQE